MTMTRAEKLARIVVAIGFAIALAGSALRNDPSFAALATLGYASILVGVLADLRLYYLRAGRSS
jgi:hypothetical protein